MFIQSKMNIVPIKDLVSPLMTTLIFQTFPNPRKDPMNILQHCHKTHKVDAQCGPEIMFYSDGQAKIQAHVDTWNIHPKITKTSPEIRKIIFISHLVLQTLLTFQNKLDLPSLHTSTLFLICRIVTTWGGGLVVECQINFSSFCIRDWEFDSWHTPLVFRWSHTMQERGLNGLRALNTQNKLLFIIKKKCSILHSTNWK